MVRFEKKKVSNALVVVTIISVFILCSNVATSTITNTSVFRNVGTINYSYSGLSYLHTEGGFIKNEFGQTVNLRGCTKMCMEFVDDPSPQWYNVNESDFESIKNLGANVVRIDLALSLLFPTFDVSAPDPVYLGHMDNIVNWCGKREIYVLFDCHGYYPQMGAPVDFWDDNYTGIRNPYRNMIRDFWVFIANQYKGNPIVFGFDLYNEPYNAVPTVDRPTVSEWKIQVEEWIDAIRAVNPSLLFIVENAGCQQWGHDDWRWLYTNPVNRPNVVYSPHLYPQSDALTWKNFSWIPLNGSGFIAEYVAHNYAVAKEQMQEYLTALYASDAHYPMWIGEFGLTNSEEALHCLKDMTDIFDKHGWSWTYWAWAGRPQPGFMLVLPDWTTLSPQGMIVHEQLRNSPNL